MRAKSVRLVCKTVAVIPGNLRRQAPWKQQSYVPKQSHSSGDVIPMQAAPDGGQGIVSHNEGNVSDEVDSIQHSSLVEEVGQVEKLSFERVHETRLDKVIVGLTLSESEALQVPRAGQDYQSPIMARAIPVDSLTGSLSPSQRPTLFTKAWKRLAREVGMVTKDKTSENAAGTVDNTINSGRKRMSIDFEDKLESKKFCMDFCKGDEEQNIEVVAARQHHRAL